MLEELLEKYDLLHSSIICGGKEKLNINYILDGKVYISLVALIKGEEKKFSYDFDDNDNFKNFIVPKILERFISKNVAIEIRRIMGSDSVGTLVVERKDGKDSLIIRNCSKDVMDFAEYFLNSLLKVNEEKTDNSIIISEDSHSDFENYIKYNIIFDYAKYKKEFDESDYENKLLLLNIARYAYTFENSNNETIWKDVVESYLDNQKVVKICEDFKNLDFSSNDIYIDALVVAEYEKNNDMLFHNNVVALNEAMTAAENNVSFFDDSYLNYWRDKAEYYNSTLDGEHQAVALEFIDAHELCEKEPITVLKNMVDVNKVPNENNLISKLKDIKRQRLEFSSIINNPLTEEEVEEKETINPRDHRKELIEKLKNLKDRKGKEKKDKELVDLEKEIGKIFVDFDKEELVNAAKIQALDLIKKENESEQLKKDAEEFAKEILKKEKEHQEIIDAAEEQARRIIELEKENEELRRLAEDNAKFLYERDKKLEEEEKLRGIMYNSPVKSQDIDRINSLLSSISDVKELDFAVNHPTVMQELIMLEEKIITYLKTHNNVVYEEDKIVPIEQEEMIETKPVIELLSMIRNTYVSSHYFEKDGRHTVINVMPVDEDTYRVVLYSVKDEDDDILMDAFFEEYQLNDNTIKELCDIFKDGAVIIASKTDNVPPDKADYLAIDSMDNAIKFMGCKKELIEKVKTYL